MIDYTRLKKSLKHLERQFANYRDIDDSLPEIMQEAVAESVIRRFEICRDCLWKTLKRTLTEEAGMPDVPNSPKPVLRLANENALLPSGIEQWLRYADARVGTSHDYSGEKAQEALGITADFIKDAIRLYQTLSGEEWE